MKSPAFLAAVASSTMFVDAGVNGPTFAATKCLDQQFLSLMQTNGIPGGSLAVMKKGELAYAQGYGSRDVIDSSLEGRPFLASTPSRIFSVSKTLTATTVVLMLQADLLQLDDFVFLEGGALRHFIDGLPPNSNPDPRLFNITVRHLLQHTGGLAPRLIEEDPLSAPELMSTHIASELGILGPTNCDDLIRFMVQIPLDRAPGESPEYSNMGYCFLQGVIEGITGMAYEDAVSQWLLEPLEIDRGAFFLPKSTQLEDKKAEESEYDAKGCVGPSVYPSKGGEMVSCAYGGLYNMENAHGFAAWTASALELVKLAKALGPPHCKEDECLLKKESRNAIEKRPPFWEGFPFWVGLGWWVVPNKEIADEETNNLMWFHEGSASGGLAYFIRSDEQTGLAYAALFNADNNTAMINYETGALLIPQLVECVDDSNWPFLASSSVDEGSSAGALASWGLLVVAAGVWIGFNNYN